MALYFDLKNSSWKKWRKVKRQDVVSAEVVEKIRTDFGLKKGEFAELMGISGERYSRCLAEGSFMSFRFYAAVDAIENAALNKALRSVKELRKIKLTHKIESGDEINEDEEYQN